MHKIIIVGAGFAGLQTAKRLANSSLDITIIDKRNYHLFQPLLYQVATAGLSPADIALPIRSIFRSQQNLKVILDELIAINPDLNKITTKDEDISNPKSEQKPQHMIATCQTIICLATPAS